MYRVWVCCAVMTLVMFGTAHAQRRRDPLLPAEVDQIRDATQEPVERLKLYIKFTRARLDAVDQALSDPKVTDKGNTIHDRLQDFSDLYDELDDNVDTYSDRRDDIRKALKLVIEADTEFQSKLRAIKDSAAVTPVQAKAYEFVLADAIDAVDGNIQDHRDLLTEQEELAKQKKLIKPDQQNTGKSK